MGIQQSQCCGGACEDTEFMEEFQTFQIVCQGLENSDDLIPVNLGHQAVDQLNLILGVDFTKTNKMLETVSCLPPLSDKQIEQQVDYILHNNRTHCLTQPDQPYIYNSPPATPSSRSTPPQFRYKVGKQLLSELAACSIAFPDAFIRLMYLDSKLKKLIRVSLCTNNAIQNSNSSSSGTDFSSEENSEDLDSMRDDLDSQDQNDLNCQENDLNSCQRRLYQHISSNLAHYFQNFEDSDFSLSEEGFEGLDSNSNLSVHSTDSNSNLSVHSIDSNSNLSVDSNLTHQTSDVDRSKNFSSNERLQNHISNSNSNVSYSFEDYGFTSPSENRSHLKSNQTEKLNLNFDLSQEDSDDLDNLNSTRKHPQVNYNFKLDLSFLKKQNHTWSNSNCSNIDKNPSLSTVALNTKSEFSSSNSDMLYDDINQVPDDYYFQDDNSYHVTGNDSDYYNDY